MGNIFDRIWKLSASPKQGKVLVIDDSVVDRTFSSKALACVYDVLSAEDGVSGISLAMEHRPDLIVLDYEMPGMNGPEVCCELKKNIYLKDIPVIFLTGRDKPSAVINSFQEGADVFLTKPVSKGELLTRVRQTLLSGNIKE